MAKDAAAHACLCAQFGARSVGRRYDALHFGRPPAPGAGRVEAPIGRHPTQRLRMAVAWAPGRGRAAASRYALVEAFGATAGAGGGASHVSWSLESGRTHQVRVHAQHLGVPLLGDPLYGGGAGAAAQALARGGGADAPRRRAAAEALAEALCGAGGGVRPLLHAAELGFNHPDPARGRLSFAAPPPPDWTAARDALRALG